MEPCHEGVTTDEQRRPKKLDQENRELRRANEILICRVLQFPVDLLRRQGPTAVRRGASRRRPQGRHPSVYDDSLQVYVARKVWRQLRREDSVVARCTAAQLMREMGIAGLVRHAQPHHHR